MRSTHVVHCGDFDKQVLFIKVFLIMTSFFGRRPLSSCLVMLYYQQLALGDKNILYSYL